MAGGQVGRHWYGGVLTFADVGGKAARFEPALQNAPRQRGSCGPHEHWEWVRAYGVDRLLLPYRYR